MPAVSKKQQRFFGYLLSNPDERKKRGISKKSAKDFAQDIKEATREEAEKKRLAKDNPDDYSVRAFVAGYFNTTAAITAIQFKTASGNIDAGTFKLYGVS